MFSSLAFASPWLLGFLAALPALWWLLRLTPPSPKKILFPALLLLQGLTGREETPARSPWWLLLLRLGIAALLILGFARPLLDPLPVSGSKGALLVAVDNDWASARDWPARQAILRDLLQKAARDGREVALLATAPSAGGGALTLSGPEAAEAALAAIDRLAPQPWPADWRQAAALPPSIDKARIGDAVWLAGGTGSTDALLFDRTLQKIAPTTVFGTATPIYTLTPPENEGDAVSIALMRAATDDEARVTLNAVAGDGRLLSHWTVKFPPGAPRRVLSLDLPPDLRNRIARFEIAAPRTAASTVLSDAAWERRAAGITGDAAELDRHSLLSEIFYIDRALKPYADLHIGALDALIKANLPVIFLTDTERVADDQRPALQAWVEKGGILVRFAGERFAAAKRGEQDADLLPVPLRSGGRSLDGAMVWGAPQTLQSFPAQSPFRDLTVPPDVTVSRQILAEPSPDLGTKTWAALKDGTPIVTARPIGRGQSVLFHVPAEAGWSNLPISGLFVEMLQKIVRLSRSSHGAATAQAPTLPPLSLLDAFGEAGAPTATALPIESNDLAAATVSPRHPPGLYGSDADNFALNLGASIGQPQALSSVPLQAYAFEKHGIDLQPGLLAAAFFLLLLDLLVSLRTRGFLKLAALAFGLFCCFPSAHAATDDQRAVELSSKPYLAYIRTGDPATDRLSELGLRGLATIVQRRTSIDAAGVASVDPGADDLAFFPLLYWPVTANQKPLSPEAARRVTYYLRHGGLILFDDADAEGAAPLFMQTVLAGVDLPPLVRLPDEHVLKRSFYLLDSFPGRFADRAFWLEPEQASTSDGVASVLAGGNGWAAAWAMDATGRPLYPCTPGGEEQREQAYRFGVNLVVYALTGNYKNGQKHAAKLLEKMDQ